MSDEILQFGFLVGVILVAVTIIIRSILQIISIYKEPQIQHKMRRLRRPKQPWVTVVIDATGKSDETTELTVKSLKKSHYYNYDILVVKGMRFAKIKSATLRQVYTKSQRGSIVVALTAGDKVEASFVKRVVAMQDGRATWRVAMGFSGVRGTNLQLMTIIQLLEINYWQNYRKAQVFFESEFLKRDNKTRTELRYGTVLRDLISILIFVAISLLAVFYKELILIWYLWLILTAYGLGVIWLQYNQTLRNKLLLTYATPLALFLLPVMGAVRELSRFTNTK